MYSNVSNLILGFHGCDSAVANRIISGHDELKISTNDYDWLGHGIYFWESNPLRALQFATYLRDHPERVTEPVNEPAVIGAVIDLDYCLNLFEANSIRQLKQAYHGLRSLLKTADQSMPENKPIEKESDLLLRRLDCAVIEYLHGFRSEQGERGYDSVRGGFWVGKPIYPNAGIKEKNHIQICVRNLNCIKGYFHPRQHTNNGQSKTMI